MTQDPTKSKVDSTRRILIRLVLGTAFLIGASGILWVLKTTKPHPISVAAGNGALTVRTIPATRRTVARQWIGYGTARAINNADVAAQVAGEVITRPITINVGVWVEKGDLLVELDSGELADRLDGAEQAAVSLESQLESLDVEYTSLVESTAFAEEAVKLSMREVDRAKQALATGAATDNEIDRLLRDLTQLRQQASDLRQRRDQIPLRKQEFEAQIRQQKANIRLAQRDVDRARITAPITGMIQQMSVDVGDWVSVGSPVCRIVDLNRIEAPLKMPISAGSEVHVGDAISLRADSPSGLNWDGRIARIAPEGDPQTRTLTIFAEIEQDGRSIQSATLLPGQFLIGSAQSRHPQSRLIVPRSAISDGRVAIVGADHTVEFHQVEVAFYIDKEIAELDQSTTQWAVISTGLDAGDLVIVSNFSELQEGLPVERSEPTIVGAVSAPSSPARSVRQ